MTTTDPTAHARHTDPDTSHAAAATVADITDTQANVHAVLEAHPDGLTHEALVDRYTEGADAGWWPPASAQSIRSRTSELVRLGLVVAAPQRGESRFGRPARIWRAVSVQNLWTIGNEEGTS